MGMSSATVPQLARMYERDSIPSGPRARLLLDHGIDESWCDDALTLDERGMRFSAQWQFPPGTMLAVTCMYADRFGEWRRVQTQGIVVWSERIAGRKGERAAYQTTLLFMDLPDELRKGLREFSHHLAETASAA
jgi:hypothetical protein